MFLQTIKLSEEFLLKRFNWFHQLKCNLVFTIRIRNSSTIRLNRLLLLRFYSWLRRTFFRWVFWRDIDTFFKLISHIKGKIKMKFLKAQNTNWNFLAICNCTALAAVFGFLNFCLWFARLLDLMLLYFRTSFCFFSLYAFFLNILLKAYSALFTMLHDRRKMSVSLSFLNISSFFRNL